MFQLPGPFTSCSESCKGLDHNNPASELGRNSAHWDEKTEAREEKGPARVTQLDRGRDQT